MTFLRNHPVAVSAVVELDLLVIQLVEMMFYAGYWNVSSLRSCAGFSVGRGAVGVRRGRKLLVVLVVLHVWVRRRFM